MSFKVNLPHSQFYDINEMDWLNVSDYLDNIRGASLFWLTSTSSNESLLSVIDGLMQVPWILLLHHIDLDLQNVVIAMIQDGNSLLYVVVVSLFSCYIVLINLQLYFNGWNIIDPWYSTLHRSIELTLTADNIVRQSNLYMLDSSHSLGNSYP